MTELLLTNEDVALSHLRAARHSMQVAQKLDRGSRELSVAMTNLDTAALWLKFDIERKAKQAGTESASQSQEQTPGQEASAQT